MIPRAAVDYFRSEVPPGRSGDWTIEMITQPERTCDPEPDPRADCFKYRPGTYRCLRRGSIQFMTDLYDEWWTQRPGINEAITRGGDILITGLGLGLVAEAILRSAPSKVGRITIVEKSPDVIKLVGPYLNSRYREKIEIVEADAFAWEPGRGGHFSVGWHDIWPDPYTPGNAAEMTQLEAHHGQWCEWQGFWPKCYLGAAGDSKFRAI